MSIRKTNGYTGNSGKLDKGTPVVTPNSIRATLLIWLIVPLAMIGVTAGLLLTGQPFGFMALLGVLSLVQGGKKD
jgi:hypothetical protein